MSESSPLPSEGERIAHAYSAPPLWYQLRGIFVATVSYQVSVFTMLNFFEQHLEDNHLEVAVGDGMFLDMVLKRYKRRTGSVPTGLAGLDLSPTMIEGARQRFSGKVPIELTHGDATRMPYETNRFDSVAMPNAIHSVGDPVGVIGEVHRVLAPGGTFKVNALLDPRGPLPFRMAARRLNAWGIKKGLLARSFQLETFRAGLERTGFAIDSEQVHGNNVEIVARKAGAEGSC
jgi:ubiquinone/menaquinone biosynthesis C-methylase UbiE